MMMMMVMIVMMMVMMVMMMVMVMMLVMMMMMVVVTDASDTTSIEHRAYMLGTLSVDALFGEKPLRGLDIPAETTLTLDVRSLAGLLLLISQEMTGVELGGLIFIWNNYRNIPHG